ncbi:hypothetical protein BUALT_Bualt01G0079100 [Buddleja alternifolia]|uniref:non-specific serine/threonine protein kinase n=1 Tax=Buddleja alternifolia TaxID=168488 RepID=A0AAV6YD66_9LAMI|nr:hypothetical protein BUALT_Bualt01G0079100 [Buddleja alternifolia]
MSKKFILSFSTLSILILTCRAQNNSSCISSSCGNIQISYPFRLRNDPRNCGHPDPIFTLECHENRTIIMNSISPYLVQSITYSNFSIRLSDPGLDIHNVSSCPTYSSIDNTFSSRYMFRVSSSSIFITFLNCLSSLSDPLYIENPFCGNTSGFFTMSRVFSYVTVGSILVSDLDESCAFDTMIEASSPNPKKDSSNYSYSEIHDLLAYGVELSWFQAMCGECEESKGTCNLEDDKIRCRHYCDEHTPFSELSFRCKFLYYLPYIFFVGLAIGGFIGLRFVFGIPYLIGLVIYKSRRRRSSMKESETIEELLRYQINLIPIKYTYDEIKKMTNNFKTKLGEGPHGTVYKGRLRSGPFVAVKMLINASISDKDYISYISEISKIHHPNVVKLIGFCIEGSKRALVHDLKADGSIAKYRTSLSYKEIFKISLGIARGIEFLHGKRMCHLGIKPENVLLGDSFNPEISDSRLGKLYLSDEHRAKDIGKMGFISPEVFYKNIGEISDKSDVYSFGMMMLEMVATIKSLNLNGNGSSDIYFPWWIYRKVSEEKDDLVIGDDEEQEDEMKMVKKMVLVALCCIQINPGDRPSMKEVVAMLEGGVEVLQVPPRPFQREMDEEIM